MIKNAIKGAFALMITLVLLWGIAWILHSKGWYHKMNEFYKYADEYDVWFMGSSHAIMSVLPEELYEEYGIRAYNLANYGQVFPMEYWIVKNLFEITKPKLVVLDVGMVGSDEKYSEANISSVKKMISSLPFGKEKISAINDLFEGDLREEFLFPLSSDHYNWEFLTEDYFRLEESYELGSDQNVFDGRGKADYVLVTPSAIPKALDSKYYTELNSLGVTYLRKLIELCQENNVEVLLVKVPLVTDEARLRAYNYAYIVGEEYNVSHFDGFELDEVFDGDTDMWDASHMNSLGGRKWTHALGEYISANYQGLNTDINDDEIINRWNERYENYCNWLDTALPSQSYFYSFLMLCTSPRYRLDISLKANSPLNSDNIAMKLLNLCNYDMHENTNDGEAYDINIVVYSETGDVLDNAQFNCSNENGITYERVRQ